MPSAVVDLINKRFREGTPNAHLGAAGTLLHQFDTIDQYDPTRVNAPSWLLSTEKLEWSDRISAVLINEQVRHAHRVNPMYSDITAGVVFNPLHVKVLCSYPSDGGSMHVKCQPPGAREGCTPGCSEKAMGPRAASRVYWGEKELHEMLRSQLQTASSNRGEEKRYNEVILDAFHFQEHLPQAIQAIFFIGVESSHHCQSTNHWAKANGHCEKFARAAHLSFLRKFGLTAQDVPLLRLDVHARVESPFSLADDPWSDPITVSKSREIIDRICLSELRATGIATPAACGSEGCHPQLWVYEGQGNLGTVQKTTASEDGRNPRWDGETVCVSLQERTDRRICFDIRDANRAPSSALPDGDDGDDGDDEGEEDDDDDETILHFGCTTITADSVEAARESAVELSVNHGNAQRRAAAVHFRVARPT